MRARLNIVISGGTGAGKTTLLNALSAAILERERIVTIEEAAELQLQQPHVIPLEARPANVEGKGEVTIRDLVRNSLRMRPDRIIVGEVRGVETLDMLQALNTGHEGSLVTVHANTADDALYRLETLATMSDLHIPHAALREYINSAIHVIVQIDRGADGLQARDRGGGRRLAARRAVPAADRDAVRGRADRRPIARSPARPRHFELPERIAAPLMLSPASRCPPAFELAASDVGADAGGGMTRRPRSAASAAPLVLFVLAAAIRAVRLLAARLELRPAQPADRARRRRASPPPRLRPSALDARLIAHAAGRRPGREASLRGTSSAPRPSSC